MAFFLTLPVLSDDAHLVAWSAWAATQGEGFPEREAIPSMGVSEPLHLHLATALVSLGLEPVLAVFTLNVISLGGILWVLWRWGGWRAPLLFALVPFVPYLLLIGPGTALFLFLTLLAIWIGKEKGGVWAGLALVTRMDALLSWGVAGLFTYFSGKREWVLGGLGVLALVLLLNEFLWGSPLPATLGAKGLLIQRLSLGGEGHPSPLPWVGVAAVLFFLPWWKRNERQLLGVLLGMTVVWWGAGFPPGTVWGLAGGLVLATLCLAFSRTRSKAPLVLGVFGLLSLYPMNRSQVRWEDHQRVVQEVAKFLPQEGCTVAFWYFGYLRSATEACLVDGSGFFDPRSQDLLAQTGTADIFLLVEKEKIRAAIQFFPAGVEPNENLPSFLESIRVEGDSLIALVHLRD
ncbi:hypothetical protein H8D30_03705 [bacterium]|nr:hypothetical protein [bacterium]